MKPFLILAACAALAFAGCGETADQAIRKANREDTKAVNAVNKSTFEAAIAGIEAKIADAEHTEAVINLKRAEAGQSAAHPEAGVIRRLEGYKRKAEAEEP